MIYALVHQFISQVIEGDELYTKVNKNVPVEESEGWTIMLMERASRFIWALGCGKKDRALFFYAIQILRNVVEQTRDITLVTDGERRYGNLLFGICCEVFRSGRRGRPPKVLREGIKIRIKNNSSCHLLAPSPALPVNGKGVGRRRGDWFRLRPLMFDGIEIWRIRGVNIPEYGPHF
ncbi:hypothetical protein CCP3SC1_770005 [Gammaproteobacteria bacterium]